MLLPKKIKILRLCEQFLLLLVMIGTIGFGWLTQNNIFSQNTLYVCLGVFVLLLIILFFLGRKIDSGIGIALAQLNFLSSQEFGSLYDRSPVAYINIDVEGSVIECNPAAVYLLRGETNTVPGINFYKQVISSTKTDGSVIRGKVAAGLTINDEEILLQTLDGQQIWVMMSVHAGQDKNQRMISLVDITEKKIVDTAKSEFVALATHQLRTPLAAIRWNLELLQKNIKTSQTPEQERYLGKIERNILLMINLINDFLNVSKLEMGTFATSIETINLSAFIDSILDEYAEKITQKQIQIIRLDTPPQASVELDSRLIHIVVSNLLSNAVKYLHDKGTINITYEIKGNKLELVVADTGIGIPEAEIGRLFTKFFRASNAHTHQVQGTGLGLYVVKQSIDKLGGSITVESKVNEGTKFVVQIPVTVV